jgi:hypothetical protein
MGEHRADLDAVEKRLLPDVQPFPVSADNTAHCQQQASHHHAACFGIYSTYRQLTMFLGSRVLLEELIFPQLVKEFTAFIESEGSSPCSQ